MNQDGSFWSSSSSSQSHQSWAQQSAAGANYNPQAIGEQSDATYQDADWLSQLYGEHGQSEGAGAVAEPEYLDSFSLAQRELGLSGTLYQDHPLSSLDHESGHGRTVQLPNQVYHDPYDPNLFRNLGSNLDHTPTTSTSYQFPSYDVPPPPPARFYHSASVHTTAITSQPQQSSSSIFDFSTLASYRPAAVMRNLPPSPSVPSLNTLSSSILPIHHPLVSTETHEATQSPYQHINFRRRPPQTSPPSSLFSSSSSPSSQSQSQPSPSPPSEPLSPSWDSSPSLPAILSAGVNKRAEFFSTPHPLPSHPPRRLAAVDAKRGAQKESPIVPTLSSDPVIIIDSTCKTCGEPIARLNLRDLKGKNSQRTFSPQKAVYDCLACSVSLDSEVEEIIESMPSAEVEDRDSLSYKDTLSAAIDNLSGLRIDQETPPNKDIQPLLTRPEKLPGDFLICDVCSRPVAHGSVRPVIPEASSSTEELVMETICVRCDSLYALCSDCGSGGGRLSSGRWRCKQLFAPGRRTCRLDHRRNPDMGDRIYTVTKVVDIPENDFEDIEARIKKMYFDTRFSALARPETLERGDGLVTNFGQVEKTTIDSWNLMSPLLRKENQTTPNIVRYLAIQTPKPPSGKSKSLDQHMAPFGFVLAEHDLLNGAMFFCFTSPWAIQGKAADAVARCGQLIVQRCRADLLETNRERRLLGLEPHSPLTCEWVHGPFKADSKFVSSMERKGFRPLDVIEKEWPEIPLQAFPPLREIFIPNRFFKAFIFYIRRFEGQDDLGSPPPSEENGKRVRTRKRPTRPMTTKTKTTGGL